MKRVNSPEILDSEICPAEEIEKSLGDICLINRWFGGISTTQSLVERVLHGTQTKHFSWLEVAAGFDEGPKIIGQRLARRGITTDITFLDRSHSHLPGGRREVVSDALALPFRDEEFDLVSCNLFAHHLGPTELAQFVREALRVSRRATLINDLIRNSVHLALVYAGFPLMKSWVSRNDGVASVRRAYKPEEIRGIVASAFTNGSQPRVEISWHYLYRMGVIIWKPGV